MDLRIKFELNKKLDKEMAFEFLGTRAGGVDFSRGIIELHPTLKNILKKDALEQRKSVGDYFDKFYKDNSKDIETSLFEIEKSWRKDEKRFIKVLNDVFSNSPIPVGKYIGYLSVINCNPRFLENKTFQIFYKHTDGTNPIIAHEVLHFFFYDYTKRRFPEIFEKLDTNNGIYWDLAELFNNVVMSSPNFISKEYSEKVAIYPDHEKYFNVVNKIWKNKPNLDHWIEEAYKYLKKIQY